MGFAISNPKISNINVISENIEFNKWLQNHLLKHFLNKPYDLSTLDKVREMIFKLSSQAAYYNAEVESLSINQHYELQISIANPVQYQILFKGASPYNLNLLTEKLNLKSFHSNNPNFHFEIIQKIRNYYVELGYSRVDVSFLFLEEGAFKKRIIFQINEGARTKIKTIRFIGNFSRSNEYYKNLLLKNALPLIKEGYYNRDFLKQSISNLEVTLYNDGFLKARSQLNHVTYLDNFESVDISILLFEGQRTIVKQVAFQNLKEFSEDQLLEIISLEIGKPLIISQLEQSIVNIKKFYQERGYLDISIVNESSDMITYSPDFSEAFVNFNIKEGSINRVKKIVINGLNITRPEVVLREIDFKENDILTSEKLENSRKRLFLLGLFRNVEFYIDPYSENISEKLVTIAITEKDPGVFSLGFGINNERGLTLRGFTGIGYDNILGTGRALSLRIDGQYNLSFVPFFERSIQMFYLEPYILRTRARGRIGLSRSALITDFNNQVASEANRTNYSIEHFFTENLFFRWQILEIVTFRDFLINNSQETNNIEIGSTSLNITFDNRNEPFNPSRGFLLGSNFEYSDPNLLGSPWIQYYKLSATASSYLALLENKWILALNARTGKIWHRSNYFIPYDKVGFFLGGQTSLRGFTLNEVFPNSNDLGGTNYKLLGEADLHVFKAELRMPFWGETLASSIFMDQGRIFFSNDLYDSGWRQSFGVGLRYHTPIGAVSIEYAWKVSPRADRGESPGALHLAIGSF
ncbi:MAG: BamA/TamA family outer membrane protein [Bdellovibrionaceae bacterium]|nr:BamA/TamA family outer membrane protein [Pseudobdellovibrionaceae bacterium]MDW8190604.1 BamA/TamA family outer membrane protein [Pseudobdellovibrionaceae bacterium]